jgi:hypothetical protein
MISNLDRYKKDLDSLIEQGHALSNALNYECFPEIFERAVRKKFGKKTKGFINKLPSFSEDYQTWYSEGKILIKQLLPDRLSDFVRHYEKPKSRKRIDYENYCIEDGLQKLHITSGVLKEKVVGPDAAVPHLQQQIAILKSVKSRFVSSLFDIHQLVQADLFNSELDAAKELAHKKFTRAAGALAGVVLERHLHQVCNNHEIIISKKSPCISDYNEALKNNGVTDIPQWRFIQHLSDIRNLCDHDKHTEPTIEQVEDLIQGVLKISKTLY